MACIKGERLESKYPACGADIRYKGFLSRLRDGIRVA